jgi:hypothetical protein
MLNNRDRLKAQTTKLVNSNCWQWQSQVSNSGYGRIMLRDQDGSMSMQSAHRASYINFIGPLPPDKKVVQTCGNRLCINPEHLELQDLYNL